MQHRTEGTVLVYLLWDDDARRWIVDPVSADGHPLDRHQWMEDPDLNVWRMTETCTCDEQHEDACREQALRALNAPMPTAEELAIRLTAAIARREVERS
jgi:hypothetical protein